MAVAAAPRTTQIGDEWFTTTRARIEILLSDARARLPYAAAFCGQASTFLHLRAAHGDAAEACQLLNAVWSWRAKDHRHAHAADQLWGRPFSAYYAEAICLSVRTYFALHFCRGAAEQGATGQLENDHKTKLGAQLVVLPDLCSQADQPGVKLFIETIVSILHKRDLFSGRAPSIAFRTTLGRVLTQLCQLRGVISERNLEDTLGIALYTESCHNKTPLALHCCLTLIELEIIAACHEMREGCYWVTVPSLEKEIERSLRMVAQIARATQTNRDLGWQLDNLAARLHSLRCSNPAHFKPGFRSETAAAYAAAANLQAELQKDLTIIESVEAQSSLLPRLERAGLAADMGHAGLAQHFHVLAAAAAQQTRLHAPSQASAAAQVAVAGPADHVQAPPSPAGSTGSYETAFQNPLPTATGKGKERA